MTDFVLDSSAMLALLFDEPGADIVADHLQRSVMSSVNWSEVATKVAERGGDLPRFLERMSSSAPPVIAFDRSQAEAAALLRLPTRALGLSLGDRACLALASVRGATALTTDQAWRKLGLNLKVELIR